MLGARFRIVPAILLLLAFVVTGVDGASSLPKSRDKWWIVHTDHFTLYGDANPKKIREVGLSLERLRIVLGSLFPGMSVRSPAPTHIFVFQDENSFGRYISVFGDEDSADGVFVETWGANYVAINGFAVPFSMRTVYHEYVHFFLHSNVEALLPVWFDEGLAEYYSSFIAADEIVEVGRAIPWHIDLLREKGLIPARDLFDVTRTSRRFRDAESRRQFYAQSWALVHYLMSRPDKEEKVERFLALLGDDRSMNVLLREAFQVPRAGLDRTLKDYV